MPELPDDAYEQLVPPGSIPPDFGGLVGMWAREEHTTERRLIIVRFGEGKPQGAIKLTPLNALQLAKMLADLISAGEADGWITLEHRKQSGLLPLSEGLENLMDRGDVDDVAGTD